MLEEWQKMMEEDVGRMAKDDGRSKDTSTYLCT